jgi:hypothetical protein
MALVKEQGVAPDLRDEIALRDKALSGDLVLVASPATVTTGATSTARTRTVTVSLKTSDGSIHTWFNGAITNGCSIADTSAAGTASIANTTLTFVNGVATKVVSLNAAAWLATETDTLTIASTVILGKTLPSVTSVETFA